MPTVTPDARDSSAKPPKGAGQAMGYEQYIERQIARTGQHVKWVDIAGALMTLAGGMLAFLLLVALVDHWLLGEGLGFSGRLLALVALLGGGGVYAAMQLLPLLLRRINPVYAAHAIEQSRPTLKNTLVNFLLLRSSREGVSQMVYQAVQQQAAARLAQMPVESAVDRSRLIRVSIAVLAIVSICCLYTVFSPKNPLRTVRRVMLPWADIAAPTRVTIEEVSPGDASTFHEGAVNVQALVRGVCDSDPVTLYYSTADGQLVDQAVPMQKPTDGFRHAAVLPAGSGGLRQDVDYYVTAGDARSKRYHVEVRPAPTIAVDRVEYVYPKYTGLEPFDSKHGDLKAIEGTRATLHAVSNQKIAAAWIDLDCKGTRNRRLTASDREATLKLALKLAASGQTPEFTSYQLRFTNEEGHENPQPIRHGVEVVRDLPPEIKLVEPTEPQVEVPANGRLAWKVWARDADFALSRVEVVAERVDRSGDVLIAEPLLNKPHDGEFEDVYVFDPAKLKLKVGDSIRYWAEARDNRQPDDTGSPEPNRSETEKFRITIVAPEKAQPRENDLANNDRQPKPQNDQRQQPQRQDGKQPQQGKPQPGQPNEKPQTGEQQQPQPGEGQQGQPNEQQKPQPGEGGQKGTAQPKDDKGQAGESGDKGQPDEKGRGQEDRRIDPMSNPGDAFEKVNEHLQQKQQQQPGEQPQKPAEQKQQPGQKPQPQPGDNGGQKQQPMDQPGEKQQPGEKPQDTPGEGQQPQPGEQSKQPNQRPGQKPMPGQQGGAGQQDASQQDGGENSRQGQGSQPSTNQKNPQPGNAQQKPSGAGQGGKPQSNAEKPVPGQDPERPEQGKPGEKPMPGEKPQGEAAKSGDNATPESTDPTRPAQGKGSEVKGPGDPKQKNERQPSQKQDTEGGDRDNEKGPGGAGQKTDDKPSPSPQEKNQTRGQKKQQSPDNQQQEGQQDQPKSPSTSPKQSDSQGGAEGDRSGGGKSGGGQTASGVSGTGGPGSSTASDQGQSKAPGSGEGETGDKAGSKVQSDKPTGQSDPQQRKGDGSQQKPGGSKAGGEKSDEAQSPAGQPKPDQQAGDPQGAGNSQDRGRGTPGGQQSADKPAGQVGDPAQGEGPQGEPQSAPSKPAAGEDPNLDYARKATDLALEHLKDQLAKEKPDQELLDKLKWTREDAQKFVDHWERMKRQAAQPGAAGADAKKKLDESLRGLGLSPRGTQLDRNTARDDTQRNLRSSRRTTAPPEYAEQVKAYKQRLSKGQEK